MLDGGDGRCERLKHDAVVAEEIGGRHERYCRKELPGLPPIRDLSSLIK